MTISSGHKTLAAQEFWEDMTMVDIDGSPDTAALAQQTKILVDREVAELADRYIDLVNELARLDKLLDGHEDQLAICLEALVAMKRFVEVDRTVAITGITRPIGMIASAIRDVTRGAKPPLIFSRPKQTSNRPSETSSIVTLQAGAAACVEVLLPHVEDLQVACTYVMRELSKFGVTHAARGVPITHKTIKRWRDEMNGRNPEVSNTIYRAIIAQWHEQGPKKPTVADAKQFVLESLHYLRNSGTVQLQSRKSV
jgi:hypothetical protein